VLALDETGDRKWGTKTAHVGRQYRSSLGKTDSGVVSVTSLWADERVYYPLHVEPYTPAHWFERGKPDPAFRTKPKIAGELVERALLLGIPFRAVVADSLYGEHRELKAELGRFGVGFVLALKPSHDWWHAAHEIGTVREAAQAEGVRWKSAEEPGAWSAVERRFRDGHTETWWAWEAECGPFGPGRHRRLVVATTDPVELPDLSTWYLETNFPRPGEPAAEQTEMGMGATALQPTEMAEVVRLYGLRNWVEQSYKQVKHELGWADSQMRSDVGIRRHWALVCCAFSFCWWALPNEDEPSEVAPVSGSDSVAVSTATERGKNRGGMRARRTSSTSLLARSAAPGAGVAHALDLDHPLEGLVGLTPTRGPRGTARMARGWRPDPPLQPVATDHR
jgi:hypothetical protein